MRDADNRRLAIWLGWTFKRTGPDVTLTRPSDHARYTTFGPSPQAELRLIELHGPNFFTDPAASWLLLEKMPNAKVVRLPTSRSWACDYDWCTSAKEGNASVGYGHQLGMEDPDQLTAIALAALKLIDSQEGK